MSTSSFETTKSILRAIIFLLIVALAIELIVFLKRSTDIPLTPEQIARHDSISRIVTPDTDVDSREGVVERPTALPLPVDSTLIDTRDPSEAGYMDGYFSGVEDGLNHDERATYDESSQYATPDERHRYTKAYRQGYAAGFADGSQQAVEDLEETL